MLTRMFVSAAALLSASAAMAQAGPVASVTSDQLVCQLSGDCAKADATLDTQDKPDARGFSLAWRTGAGAGAKTPTAGQNSGAGYVGTRKARGVATGARHMAVAAAPVGQVGRADLSISFVSGSAELTPSGKDAAQTFMQALRSPQLSGKRFMIGGHTDAVGSRELNLGLSQRRAQALVDFLVAQGASTAQFEPKGFGFDQPIPGASPKSPSNRRVEVVKID